MAPIVRIENVTKTFPGGIVAVDDVSLEVEEGEFLTMLGPSGCGKTTTLRMIGGFEFPDSGRVLLDGEDVTEWPAYKRPVNMMFQDFALFPHMTVARNIGYGLSIAGVPRGEIAGRVAEALETIELPDKAESLPSQLSNGQKQRVALARALIRRPKVLLLDEPMSALDAKLREAMQVELKHLHERSGLTFVLVTHDQTEAMVMSDRIVVMKEGRIAQSGTPTELYDHPASAYVADFIGNSNMIPGRVSASDKTGATIGFESGEIRSLLDGASLTVGAMATISIRPEKTRYLGEGEMAPEGHNVVAGTVRGCLFQGNVIRIEMNLDIATETPFFVEVHMRSTAKLSAMPQPGVRASVAFDPRAVSVFPIEAGH